MPAPENATNFLACAKCGGTEWRFAATAGIRELPSKDGWQQYESTGEIAIDLECMNCRKAVSIKAHTAAWRPRTEGVSV